MLFVHAGEESHALKTSHVLTIGRHPGCTITIDPDDLAVSREAAVISYGDRHWNVTNTSTAHAIHLIGPEGLALPIPASHNGSQHSRAIDRPAMTLLIQGDTSDHLFRLEHGAPQPPADLKRSTLKTTRKSLPRTSNERREVMVALARGYLHRYPDYDPRPATFENVASLLGITLQQVHDHIHSIKEQLAARGLPTLDEGPRSLIVLSDLLSAEGYVTAADASWLQARLTSRPFRDEIGRAADCAAEIVAPHLLQRLIGEYGPDWLRHVNAQRPRGREKRSHDLSDARFCLSTLAFDKATAGWASPYCRKSARELNGIANKATHESGAITSTHVSRAHHLANLIINEFP